MALTSQDMWGALTQAVKDAAFSGNFDPKTSTFSMAGQALNVDLANADPTISNGNIFSLGDVVPHAGGAYVPQSSLVSSYFSFLNWIKLKNDPNPNLASQINIAAGNLTAAQNNYITVQGNALTAYNQYKTAMGSTISFLDYCNTQYPLYGQAKSALDGAQAQYSQLMQQAYGPDYQTIVNAQNISGFNGAQAIVAQNTFNMPVKWGTTAPAGSGPAVLPGQNPTPPASALTSTFTPGYTLNSAFQANYQNWQTSSVQQPPLMQGLKIHVDASTMQADWASMGWSAGFHASFPVFFASVSIDGQASYQELKFDYASSDFSLDVEYIGSGLYPISANRWFDPSICINYGNSLRNGAPDFFSESGGSLARYPTQVLLGFGQKVTMKLSASDYHSFKSYFQQSSSVSVNCGLFSFGASESSSSGKQSINFNDSNNSFSYGPVTDTTVSVIGIVSSKITPR